MEEAAADIAAAAAGLGRQRAIGVTNFGERRVRLCDQARVVKLVAAQQRAGVAAGDRRVQPRCTIAEMQLALGEIGFEPEQAGHRVARSGRVDQPGAERHVAAALAMHRLGLCKDT